MRKEITRFLSENNKVDYIFTDFFDTIVHRTVHPNFVIRLWAKKMIQQFNIPLKIDDLYYTRNQATEYLEEKLNIFRGEFPYNTLVLEIYTRLKNNYSLGNCTSFDQFLEISEQAEFSAEFSTQYLNTETVETLKHLKKEGYKIYCVSDFYTNESLIENLIAAHDLKSIFDGVYVSAARNYSKHKGGLYPHLLEILQLKGEQAIMIGDNYESDIVHAEKFGIKGFFIPNKKEKQEQKRLAFGNDNKKYSKLIKNIYKTCNTKKAPPHSDYIILFNFFIEKLYQESLNKGVRNLFFLAREGFYLKKLFDYYQEINHVKGGAFINTHYLKVSRKSTLQIGLNCAEEETFEYYKVRYKNISVKNFLNNFSLSELEKSEIINDLNQKGQAEKRINDFFNSDTFQELKINPKFIKYYNANRDQQREAFNNYLASFGVNYQEEGLNIIDIGWGGTIQDALYDYFGKNIQVNGYYLGLCEFRHELNDAISKYNNYKRGLNFEVNLFDNFSATTMMANTDFYEYLCQAPHGTAMSYNNNPEQYVVEKFMESEKKVYEEYMKDTQEFMFEVFKDLCKKSQNICYSLAFSEKIMTRYALKLNTIVSLKKLKRTIEISKGFYDNIGNNDSGEELYKMNISVGLKRKIKMVKSYLISPEKLLIYVYRTKITMYSKNPLLFIPTFPLYYYILFNRYLKNMISTRCYLKFTYFR
ncbi:HAD hydrolase-like protein [Tamlana sp. 2_MG-2023]|uniref:HAD family hydrolase n=1 Tax=unclassified Tamlana TaxID=2614803 RepID=UPI0026E3E1A5|nr:MULTISPECIES: HAD family hydrolase [unclassified Tamlana]MDO6759477.1 HAD hydrolase-like protein [Tamlana sp. 2_MG-2023]MDO6790384.1 HAD hydrolase-like protein [Tamlana sp. 1_MG-2023]